jgi:hypothetical protein
VKGSGYEIPFSQEPVIQLLADEKYRQVPIVQVYYSIYQMLESPDVPELFLNLQDLLVNQSEKFAMSEQKVMFQYAQNYCIRKINGGNMDFIGRLMVLYKIILERDIFIEGKYLPEWRYKNIVWNALRNGELEWTYTFIESYKNRLRPEDRENAYTYNLAYYYFFMEDFSKTLELLNTVEFTDLLYTINAKSLLLKTFFELDEFDALQSLAHSFRVFLNRNRELSDQRKKLYLNLISFILRIYKANFSSTEDRKTLREELAVTTDVADKGWLLSKMK